MTELQRQAEAHKMVRDRLFNPPKREVIDMNRFVSGSDLDKIGKRLAKLENDNLTMSLKMGKEREELTRQLKSSKDREEALLLDIADLHARILSQAGRICTLEGLGEGGLQEKRPVMEIIAEVLKEYPGITWPEIAGVRRERRLVIPRQHCMYEISKQRPDLSLPTIGRLFGGRDHTTVLHSVNKASAKIESDPTGIEWMERKAEQAKRSAAINDARRKA